MTTTTATTTATSAATAAAPGRNRRVLISGAGIGGPALAYWLDRYGFTVTIVEASPQLRPGGQAIDVRGPALDVAARMGVLDRIRDRRVRMRGMSMVDGDGKELFSTTERTITGGEIDSPDVEILRDDLCTILAEAAGPGIEYLFGDSLTSVEQDETGVRVGFRHHPARTFDLVVGADGLHSNTRKLVFGPEADYLAYMGTYLSVWTMPNYLGLDRWQLFHQAPGGTWGGGVMSVRGNTECRVYMGFESADLLACDHRDTDALKRVLADRLGGQGWELPRMLGHMWDAPDFHLDAMAQIRMDSWSSGRVVLLGDAAYCASPLSGQGTTLAIAAAYVLAGELKAADGDHIAAFAAYEEEMREYVRLNQELAYTNKARVEAQAAAELGEDTDLDTAVPDFQEAGEIIASLVLKDY
ncbi:FAD-dependent monooxygenase [Yinghuangia soli]|uniref:FAD-dependent monooxygenase n=1 Tax=Yinghuangia soli TaxID=2908204 RepID=A0AA41TZN7_9ACTN|nr:FAD-dependent monooxygenase [Yinghuangia soli]MCF2527701.1 FAD-dependent monooxygenase [Yinghuangia soli]